MEPKIGIELEGDFYEAPLETVEAYLEYCVSQGALHSVQQGLDQMHGLESLRVAVVSHCRMLDDHVERGVGRRREGWRP